MIDWNGFDKGVIGKKLPSDTTLNNMRKADLIELLHLAESNHRTLAETYKIAIDTSKCNHCPLSIDTRRAEQIRADAIDESIKTIMRTHIDMPNDYANEIVCITKNEIKDILMQLKVGGKNDR